MRRILSLLCGVSYLVVSPSVSLPMSPLDEPGDAIATKCKEICQPEETWRTIPWQTNLIDAQNLAAQVEKPLFIWAMDGHPLGCT